MIAAVKSATYFGLKRALTRSNVHANWQWFLRAQSLPAEELARMQAELLIALCRSAARDVPAYRERFRRAGLTLTEPQLALEALPVLTRDELIANNDQFRTELEPRSALEVVSTSGSTGAPLRVVRDARARDWSLATTFLFNAWLGLHVGVPYLFLWGSAPGERDRAWSLRRLNLSFLHGRRTLDSSTMSTDKERSHLQVINQELRCDYLVGYANEIYNLATRSLEQGPRVNRAFKAVVTTAEDLSSSMRATIERAFRARVFNRYGSRETGDLASECEHQTGLHVNPLFAVIEVADEAGRVLPYGQEGQLLVTGLHNRVMPLIRYAIGDRGVLRAPERCRCGREWPTITALTGRVNEFVYLPDGVRLRAAVLDELLEPLPGLVRYQLYQESETQLVVRLKSSLPHFITARQSELARVAERLRQTSTTAVEIRFEQAELQKSKAGKELKILRSPAFEAALRARGGERQP